MKGVIMKEKTIILNKGRDVTLTPYIATQDKKVSFLICPGGAYRNCDESEGKPVAKAFNELGYNAFILRYSVGKHYRWPYPLEDFDQAMEHLLAHASDYAVDPEHIVAAGFSAGGHVVSTAGSLAKHKPFAVISCYGLSDKETLAFCAPDAPDAAEVVNADTRPHFLASSRNDWIVPIFNTTRLIDAFQQHYTDYESHIYGYALHGFSVGEAAGAAGPLFCSRVGDWVKDSLTWLDELISGRYRSIRECAQYQDTNALCFSTMNSCKLICETPEAIRIIKRKFPAQFLLFTAAKKQIGDFMDTVSMKNLFELVKVDAGTLAKMDAALSAIPIRR